ncbi:hypothetical protein ACN28E_46740 [Archangium lansingense]|uniref:hypothetical protein n=1 Tax=Archangium lansingense TaxID=2995310 RepID=UPI003B7F0308
MMKPSRKWNLAEVLRTRGVMILGAALVLSACGSLEEASVPVEQALSTAKQAAACEDCEPGGGGGGGGPVTPHIEFFEGNNASQDSLGKVYLPPNGEFRSYDLTAAGTNIGIPNDEARSMVLRNIPAGTLIVLCDCPHSAEQCLFADWVYYKVRYETIVSKTIGSFEEDLPSSSENLVMGYWQHPWRSGSERVMDGKVSVIQVFAPGVPDEVVSSVGCDY